MTRRELIQKTSLALGYTLSAPVLMGILNGCKANYTLNYTPVFFTEDQAKIISALTDIIIPPTETPGAKDAGVPIFIDTFIDQVFSADDKNKFVAGIEEFSNGCKELHQDKFIDAQLSTQITYAKKVHDDAIKEAGSVSEGWWNNNSIDRPFILKMKELTILGFFTSEVGATQVLQYNMAPGPYQGCVPLETVGKAWA